MRFLAMKITKVKSGCKYAEILEFAYIAIIQQYT